MIRHSLRRRGRWWQLDFQWLHRRYRFTLQTTNKQNAEALAQVHLKRIIHNEAPPTTLGALVVRYLNMARVEKRSWRSDKSMAKIVLEHWGPGKTLDDIKTGDVQDFKLAMSKRQGKRGQLSHASVNRHLALLKTMFNRAIEWEMFNRPNPCMRVKLYQESSHTEYFTPAEIRRLLEAAGTISRGAKFDIGRYFVHILTVAIMTGMRLGEILKLRWADVRDGMITVRAENAKSKRARSVPVAPELQQVLASLPSAGGEYIFPIRRSPDVIRNVWTQVKIMAGVKREARFHSLRHSFASLLMQGGVDQQTLREILGHTSLTMTGIYTHSSLEKKRDAVRLLCDQNLLNLPQLAARQKVAKT